MIKHINAENIENQFTFLTNVQKKIGISANSPAGFQNGCDKRHSAIVNKNGNVATKKLTRLRFICDTRFDWC